MIFTDQVQDCYSERSEESDSLRKEILRFAQNDSPGFECAISLFPHAHCRSQTSRRTQEALNICSVYVESVLRQQNLATYVNTDAKCLTHRKIVW
jgi:hypothetical protein